MSAAEILRTFLHDIPDSDLDPGLNYSEFFRRSSLSFQANTGTLSPSFSDHYYSHPPSNNSTLFPIFFLCFADRESQYNLSN